MVTSLQAELEIWVVFLSPIRFQPVIFHLCFGPLSWSWACESESPVIPVATLGFHTDGSETAASLLPGGLGFRWSQVGPVSGKEPLHFYSANRGIGLDKVLANSLLLSSHQVVFSVQLFTIPWTAAHQASVLHHLPEFAQVYVHRKYIKFSILKW